MYWFNEYTETLVLIYAFELELGLHGIFLFNDSHGFYNTWSTQSIPMLFPMKSENESWFSYFEIGVVTSILESHGLLHELS